MIRLGSDMIADLYIERLEEISRQVRMPISRAPCLDRHTLDLTS